MPSRKTRSFMPDKKIKVVRDNLKSFYQFMYERHTIWNKRFIQNLPRPWTKNVILDEFNFTNVYRELDRNTIWLINNVIRDRKLSPMDMMWKIIVFRYFNKTELFDFMGGIPDYDKYQHRIFQKNVLAYKKKHGRVFTIAYMVNPPKHPKDVKLGLDKFYCKNIRVLHKLMPKLWAKYVVCNDPKKFNKHLVENLSCIAGFLAYEIYCDLCYTDWFKHGENDFVNVGPGAKFGIDLLFPNRTGRDYVQDIYLLKRISHSFFKNILKVDFPYLKEPLYEKEKRLTLRCIEHSLCEYSKYWKMQLNVGKPRKKFETITTKKLIVRR